MKALTAFAFAAAFLFGLASRAAAACGEECGAAYSYAVAECYAQYAEDPKDSDELADCMQNAREDHGSCAENCVRAGREKMDTGFLHESRSKSLESITFMILDRFDPKSS